MTLLESLTALGAESVGLALDMDKAGWAASVRLAAVLADAGLGVGLLTWPETHKGLDDCLAAGATYEILTQAAVGDYLEARTTPTRPPPASGRRPTVSREPTLLDGLEVLETPWPSPPFVVPDLLPTGLSLLAGKSKIGKSFAVLDLCISVATGTAFLDEACPLPQGKVLYLAFEDTPRNVARRMEVLMRGREHLKPALKENLKVAASNAGVPRMPGGAVWLRERVLKEADYRLVVIDTLERFRPSDEDGRKHSYSGDYDLLTELKAWAEEHDLAVLLVHHVRKNIKDADDIFDAILGSTGILGAPDTILLLLRDRGTDNGKLIAAGREVQHIEVPLTFDKASGRWLKSAEGGASPGGITPEEFLKSLLADGAPMMANDVFAAGGKEGFSVDMLQRAKRRLAVETKKVGKGWAWRLMLPRQSPEELEGRIAALTEALDKALEANDFDKCANISAERNRLQEELDKRRAEG